MYLKDMRHTNGHVSSLTSCLWDPSDKNKFITAATDATIRVWDVESSLKQQEVVVVRGAGKSKGNRKLSVTAMGYPMEQDRGKYLVSGHDDGSISIWSTLTTNKVRADINIDHAHSYGSEITSVVVHRDGNRIYSRSNDSTIKLWDIRKLKNNGLGGGGCGAVSVVDGGVVSTYPQTSISLSPNGNKVLVATNDGVIPELVFFDSADLTELYRKRIEIDGNRSGEQYRETGANKSKVSLVKVFWHKKIEQLAVTNSLGNTQIFYNDNKNSNDTAVVKNKGIIQCINKKASTIKDSSKGSATDGGDYGVVGKIITPHALPLFKEESASVSQSARLRKMAKIRKNPVLSAKPEPPVNAGRQGKGGMIGTSETQYIMRSIMKDTSRDEDPRAALLKHAAEAEANPIQ
ncbi:WD repeat-containing protein 70 [Zancudomyces culisetae]|uniref:WD repeat-containing protein 70 n=1 Tax=Zancudomyces culisetae TaxID=1213189 RepID=A0A1R1PWJ0_ZANCU|nr:WD repeat-containing protein 70 [Zancudomyces culisetae]|eukprot:OMH85340.1 WD repeat-containing protein 70 [Zancudomyces culisetae]